MAVNRVFDFYHKKLAGHVTVKLSSSTIMKKAEKEIVIEFNRRKIITLKPDGTHIIDTGGWRSPSVRSKIETAIEKLGFTIVQQRGIWYVTPLKLERKERFVFTDGMTIKPDGTVLGAKVDLTLVTIDSGLINDYTLRWFDKWQEGFIPPPNPSDPYTFYGVVADKKKANFVEMRQQMIDYYTSEYYFGSLVMVAIQDAGGAESLKMDVVTKLHIEGWLKTGTIMKSQLIQGTSNELRELLKSFLFKLHGIRGTGVKKKK